MTYICPNISKKIVLLCVKIVLLISFHGISAQITSTAAGGAWNVASTWVGNVVPTAADNVIIATTGTNFVTLSTNVAMNMGTTVTVNTGAALRTTTTTNVSAFDTLVVNGLYSNNGTLTITSSLSGNGNFDNTISSASILILSGSITISTLTVGVNNNTVIYNGGNQTIKEPETISTVKTYRKLIISGSGTKNLTQTIANTVQGLTLNRGTKLNISGNFTFTLGTIGATISDALTFDASYTGNRNIFSLTINSTGSIKDLHPIGGTITIASTPGLTNNGTIQVNSVSINTGNFISNNGIITCNTFSNTASGTFINARTGLLNFNGAAMSTAFTFDTSASGNTVNYSSGSNQTVRTGIYSNLVLSNSGTKSINTAASGTLTSSLGTLTISGAAKANIANTNVGVGKLNLGGIGQSAGIYSSTTNNYIVGSGTVNVLIGDCNKPTISAESSTTFCTGELVTLTSSAESGNQWYKDGVPIDSATASVFNATTSGTYTVMTTSETAWCSSVISDGISVIANALPIAGLSSSDVDNSFCIGTSVTFTATGGIFYNFKVAGLSVQSGSLASFTTTTLTNGQVVTVDVTNASGCVATSAAITNTVDVLPIAGLISSDSDNTFCAGTLVTYTATGGTNYDFRVAGVSVQNSATATYTTTAISNGQVVDVIVTNASGCFAISSGITNTVNELTTTGSVTTSICAGETYVWPANGQSYTTAQHNTEFVVGCNTATLNLTITPLTTNGSITKSQFGGTYTWSENNVTYSNTTFESVVSGCNTATLDLTILPAIPGDNDDAGVLDGSDYPIISQLTSDGISNITEGCAGSILVIVGRNFIGTTAVKISGVNVASFAINDSTSITALLPSGSLAGQVTVTSPIGSGSSVNGFTVNENSSSMQTITACDSYTWTAGTGTTYTASGTYTSTAINASGCMHIKTLVLTITKSTSLTQTINVCDSYTWPLNNQTYTQSGVYIVSGTNVVGCVDTNTLLLTVTPSTTDASAIQYQVGGTYTWVANGITYDTSTIQTVVSGCNTATLNLTIAPITETTWNGAAWSYGAPTAAIDAIINGNYSTVLNGAITAKKLTVNGGVLTINSGNLILVNELINNAGAHSVVFENNANLIQTSTAVNMGAVTIKRNSSALKLLDYSLWSSPVANQNLLNFSPATVLTRFYTYNTATNLYNALQNPTNTNFKVGEGYLIRMPNSASAIATTIYPGVFIGVPNNGTISVDLTNNGTGQRFNAIGNPYPSPISITQFVSDNRANITGSLYFWRKTNATPGPAYCTWNNETFVSNIQSQVFNPNGIIQTGQGFFVEAKNAATSLIFNNSQRAEDNSGQFFKTKQGAEHNRIWLNVTNDKGEFSQMAINYTSGALQGIDEFDARYFNDAKIALNSVVENTDCIIQGRPLPFDKADVVPLSFTATTAGMYTIAIDKIDGLFRGSQEVILKDNFTGTATNLKLSSYSFVAEVGSTSIRFVLIYQNTLSINLPIFTKDTVHIKSKNGIIYINSGLTTMQQLHLYDANGRLLFKNENINNFVHTIDASLFAKQVVIVKITSVDNKEVTKKITF